MLQSSRRMFRLSTNFPDINSPASSYMGSDDTDSICLDIDIPDDIIVEIVEYLPHAEILRCCLMVSVPIMFSLLIWLTVYKSKRIHTLLAPSLYASVELKSNQQCRLILKTFSNHPGLASLVRKLLVCPARPSTWGGLVHDKSLKESEIASSVEQLAAAGRLKRLHTFRWEGVEAPYDKLWSTLRTWYDALNLSKSIDLWGASCPLLKSIGTTVGLKTQDISPESNVRLVIYGTGGKVLQRYRSAPQLPWFARILPDYTKVCPMVLWVPNTLGHRYCSHCVIFQHLAKAKTCLLVCGTCS